MRPFESVRTCSMCGSKVVDEARFCPQCGFALPRTPSQEKAKPVERPAVAETAAADPFSHTVPADPKELDRIREMIAQKQQGPAVAVAAVPIRERKLGTTVPIEAVDESNSPQGVRGAPRDATLESPAVRESDFGDRQTPQPTAPQPAAPRQAVPVSPRAATTATAAPTVGAKVRVMWSDGNSYEATVVQLAPTHCLVRFTNDQVQWVETRFIVST